MKDMSRRAPETLADYLVVAICPALIMLLVGSLMYFLVEVFYQGEYRGRLLWVMAMFVLGIVGIARPAVMLVLVLRVVSRRTWPVVLLVSLLGAVLFVACTAFVAYDQFVFRQTMVSNISMNAEMMARNIRGALTFADRSNRVADHALQPHVSKHVAPNFHSVE
jgi:hypothetical protein